MIAEVKPYLEILYFITGGPVLALCAFYALKQISLAKNTVDITMQQLSQSEKSLKTASLRDAYKISADQVHIYATDIVPRLNEIDKYIKEQELTVFTKSVVSVESDGIRVSTKGVEGAVDQLIKIAPVCTDAVNRLETFSLYFISKVASEELAFSSIGATYVSSVGKLLPFIVITSGGENFNNILKLYSSWSMRLEKQKLEKDRRALEKKLKGMKSDVVAPIGTT